MSTRLRSKGCEYQCIGASDGGHHYSCPERPDPPEPSESDIIRARICSIKSRLMVWEHELPEIIQPGRSHLQNIEDFKFLIKLIEEREC